MAVSRLSQTSLQNAFQKFNNTWDGVSAVGGMDSLGTVVQSTASSGATFTNIPQTYQHLQLRFFVKSQASSNDFSLVINGVSTGTSYSYHSIKGQSGSLTYPGYASQPFIYLMKESAEFSGFTSGNICTGIIDFLDYANTNKGKTVKSLLGTAQNGGGFLKVTSGFYNSSSAITQLDIVNGYNWAAGTQISLYGIK